MIDRRDSRAFRSVVAGTVVVTTLLAGCGNQSDAGEPAMPPASLPPVDLSEPPVVNARDPSVRAGAVAAFIDEQEQRFQQQLADQQAAAR